MINPLTALLIGTTFIGVCLFIFWIPQFADIIRALAAKFGSGTARQLANAHTIFNVSLGLIFLPFVGIFSKIILKILPEEKADKAKDLKLTTRHLDYSMISTPALAIDLARVEISRMAKLLGRMLEAVIIPFLSKTPEQDKYIPHLSLLEGIDTREETIDFLEEKIDDYLIQVSREQLTKAQVGEIFKMMSIANDIESIGDLIHRNMVPLIAKKESQECDFSHEGKEELSIYHTKVVQQIKLLEESFAERNLEKAHQIMEKERKYLDLESQYRAKHLQRLLREKEETIKTHEIHMELMDLLKQIIVYSSNIATTFFSTEKFK